MCSYHQKTRRGDTCVCVMICDVCTQWILINIGITGEDYFRHRRCGAKHIQLSASISHWLITWEFLFRLKQWAVELLMFEARKERLYNKIVKEGNKTKWNYLERRKWNFHFVQNCLQEGSAISSYQFQCDFNVYRFWLFFAAEQWKFFVRSLWSLMPLTRICALTKPQLSDKNNPNNPKFQSKRPRENIQTIIKTVRLASLWIY